MTGNVNPKPELGTSFKGSTLFNDLIAARSNMPYPELSAIVIFEIRPFSSSLKDSITSPSIYLRNARDGYLKCRENSTRI